MSDIMGTVTQLPQHASERLQRRWLPSLLLAGWRAGEALAVTGARLNRRLRRPLTIEFYYALDCPYSAIAIEPLRALAARHRAVIDTYLVRRDSASGEPDAAVRLAYMLRDAQRLAQRYGLSPISGQVPDGNRVRRYTLQAISAEQSGHSVAFAAAALRELWAHDSGGPAAPRLASAATGADPCGAGVGPAAAERRLARNRRRLLRRGHWAVPSVRIARQWFFAHERLEQIDAWLARLAR